MAFWRRSNWLRSLRLSENPSGTPANASLQATSWRRSTGGNAVPPKVLLPDILRPWTVDASAPRTARRAPCRRCIASSAIVARAIGVDHALIDELVGEKLAHRWMILDPLDHFWLRVGGLVLLVVTEAPVTDQIDERIASERAAKIDDQVDCGDARFDVVGVDVHDGNVEAFGQVRSISRGTGVDRIGRKPDLIVRNQVDGAAGFVAGQGLQVEDFRNDSLTGERGVAVDENRYGPLVVERRDALRVIGLQRARAAFDDRIDRLEMARIVSQGYVDALILRGCERSGSAVMVFDVAHHVVIPNGHAILRPLRTPSSPLRRAG
jgi:hypothetical protein